MSEREGPFEEAPDQPHLQAWADGSQWLEDDQRWDTALEAPERVPEGEERNTRMQGA